MSSAGLTLDFPASSARVVSLIEKSSTVWSDAKPRIFGEELSSILDDRLRAQTHFHYLETLPRTFAFGYFLGSGIAQMLAGNREQILEAGILGGLLNSFASIFDKICDNYPDVYPALVTIASVHSVAKAMTQPSLGYWQRASGEASDLMLKVLYLLMGEYFERCRVVLSRQSVSVVGAAFNSALLRAYEGEIRSRGCLFGADLKSHEIRSIMHAKSCLPASLLFFTSFTAVQAEHYDNLSAWYDIADGLGTAVWITDDISDLARDLRSQRWNYVWLALAERHGFRNFRAHLQNVCLTDLDDELVSTGLIAEVAGTAVSCIEDSMGWLGVNARCDIRDFQRDLLAWLRSWLFA